MHSFEVLLGYESVDRPTFSTLLRSTPSYPNETSLLNTPQITSNVPLLNITCGTGHNQSYCNISMKNGSNVIISKYDL
jgi:hypothetical protein